MRSIEHLDRWAEMEAPTDDMRLLVSAWVLTKSVDPYVGMRREPGFPNLWFGRVTGTADDHGSVVTCSYFIYDRAKVVRCNGFARLSLPL